MLKKYQTEKNAIKLVLLGNVIIATIGITFFYLTNSHAILMDASYSFIDFIAALLTLKVVFLMSQQANQSQPFGYAIYEPVLNFIKGTLIMLVILVALYASVVSLLSGGRIIDAEMAVFYSIIVSIFAFTLAYLLYTINKEVKSSLVDVDLKGWFIGAFLSIAVGISFAISIWMSANGYEKWVPYVDPIVILILILVVLPLPLQILKENGLQILGRSENSKIADEIRQSIVQIVKNIHYLDMRLRYLKIGRMVNLQIYLQLPDDTKMTLLEQDDLKLKLYQHFKKAEDYLSLDVSYTAKSLSDDIGDKSDNS